MSKREGEQGQVLVLFAGGVIVILGIAALVFDVGQALVDRRTEQNAADAGALAGARYIPTATGTYQGLCSARTAAQIADAQLKQVNTACDVAIQYLAADHMSATVTVKYPPGPESQFSALPNNIEVQVGATRPSFFSGVFGRRNQSTGAMGVAANSSGYSLPYSFLALDPCGTSSVTGNGSITANGTVHVDSACNPALQISGNGALHAPECDTVGTESVSGNGVPCTINKSGVQTSGDPLADLPAPALPTNLGIIAKEPGEAKNPANCGYTYGALSSTVTTPPGVCTFPSSFSGHTYRMSPGYYPGGLQLLAGTFYMEPGIYYFGGGGLSMGGNGAVVTSVNSGTTVFGGGVLLYNGSFHVASFCSGGVTTGCPGPMSFNGSSAVVNLKPIQTTIYKNMVIFGDRTTAAAITLNGSSTNLNISGTVYAPKSLVTVNGSGATSIAVQVIAYDFQVTGSPGSSLTVTYSSGGVFQLTGAGLVQ
jgi:Putative Flp pilus-assembly TadE/G-like